MTDWSKHVHRFAKKHNMTYKKANRSRKCKETYKKRKTSPRRKMSPRRRRNSPRRKRRMNAPADMEEFIEDLEVQLYEEKERLEKEHRPEIREEIKERIKDLEANLQEYYAKM